MIKAKAIDLGFDLAAIAPIGPSPDYERYARWIEAGYAGEMGYLVRHAPLKADPRLLLPAAQSLILVALNYAHPVDAALRADPSRGQIAAYALGNDYHDIMRAALIELDGWLRAQTGRSTHGRAFVDSAPVLERSWAMQAGLGFIGKNACLINPGQGSFFFLGGLLVPEALAYDEPPEELPVSGSRLKVETDVISTFDLQPSPANPAWQFADDRIGTCGACTRCLDICPTGALVSPWELDARLCISYLTIELRGAIPLELRPRLGNWVFGCDLCQDVCPWNRDAPPASHPRLQPEPDRLAPPLLELLALDRDSFARRFRGSAVKRAKWEGFMRNVCVAAGNWGDPAAAELLTFHLNESPEPIASHAAWALAQLRGDAGRPALVEPS
ncbi:MAG: DUF1730 domain-containing protein [Caldilineales bacterium]|nr:DUF1730 domain-containing protein [Caldilineales bacterium]